MAILIKASNANEMYEKAFKMILEEGESRSIPNKADTKELMHVLFELDNPIQKWIYSRKPAMNISFALAELFWIINGDNRRCILDTWNKSYSLYAADKCRNIYHGAYGYRLREIHGIDQIKRAYLSLKNNPNNRQTVMIIWSPSEDMPNMDGEPQSKDIPCNICSMLKVQDNKLEWSQIMRSNDIFLGLPYNLIQFTSLQEIISGWLGVGIGTYNHYSDSLHLYVDKTALIREYNYAIENTDLLSIPYEDFEMISRKIKSNMELLTFEKEMTTKQLMNVATLNSEFEAYNNIMYLIAAYPIWQKFNNAVLAEEIVGKCTNSLYKYLWKQWKEEKAKVE